MSNTSSTSKRNSYASGNLNQKDLSLYTSSNYKSNNTSQYGSSNYRSNNTSQYGSGNMLKSQSLIPKINLMSLTVLGAGGVGKSCLILQYLTKKFIDMYDPTIEDTYRAMRTIDGNAYHLIINDTAGQDEISQIGGCTDETIRSSDGFLLVYSITNSESFKLVERFYQIILTFKSSKLLSLPIVLVANKTDLINRRTVTTEEGELLANKLSCKYMEVTATCNSDVDCCFQTLARNIVEFKASLPDSEEDRKKPCTIL